jgi:arginine metabolism regulation protein II
MSASLGTDLVSGSVDASLAEVDIRSRDPDRPVESDIVIGPFAVLDFSGSAPSKAKASPTPDEIAHTQEPASLPQPDDIVQQTEIPATHSDDVLQHEDMPAEIPDPSPVSMIDSLSNMDDFLHWSDILSFSPDQSGFATHPTLSAPFDFSFDVNNDAISIPTALNSLEDPLRLLAPQQTSTELRTSNPDVLKDGQLLLKHFQDVVIPRIMAIPFGQKSPWKILNLPAAVVAYGDTTYLGTEGVSHARLANLYALFACAAIDLALQPSAQTIQSSEYWHQLADQTYQQAKDHIQISLQHETAGPKKAKYKDQLMAANILIQYAVSTIRIIFIELALMYNRFYRDNSSSLDVSS